MKIGFVSSKLSFNIISGHGCWKQTVFFRMVLQSKLPFNDNDNFLVTSLVLDNHSQCLHGWVSADNVKNFPLTSGWIASGTKVKVPSSQLTHFELRCWFMLTLLEEVYCKGQLLFANV